MSIDTASDLHVFVLTLLPSIITCIWQESHISTQAEKAHQQHKKKASESALHQKLEQTCLKRQEEKKKQQLSECK